MAASKTRDGRPRTRVVITRREHEPFEVGDVRITISRGLRNRSTCRVIIEAPPDVPISRSDCKSGPDLRPPNHGGNYIDPRGDVDPDAAQ